MNFAFSSGTVANHLSLVLCRLGEEEREEADDIDADRLNDKEGDREESTDLDRFGRGGLAGRGERARIAAGCEVPPRSASQDSRCTDVPY